MGELMLIHTIVEVGNYLENRIYPMVIITDGD
jgi:hypothetical protein